jgi:hypothetical protein
MEARTMTRQALRWPSLGILLLGLVLGGGPSLAGSAKNQAQTKGRPCTGPAVALDPDRFACAARKTGRDPHEVPLPRAFTPDPHDDGGIDLADGVSLEGQLGRRDGPSGAGPSLDGIASKRTAIVPRTEEPGLGKSLMHGTSDGLGLGLNFDFESR